MRQVLLATAATLGLLLLAVAALHASADHWHIADDLTNLRWSMEHRDAPWRALTDRHSVHDHVRPLTLMASWGGAQLSDGAWWGVRAAHLALLLGGLAGVVTLGRRLHGPAAGVLAGLVLLVAPGFGDAGWWNAWLCSSGELCAGIWALWAADRALARGKLPLLGLALLLAAGLFKEPGWLFALPLAGLCVRHQRAWLGSAPLLMAAAGIAFTWHPANVVRAQAVDGGLLQRIDRHLDQLVFASQGPEALADPGWWLRAAVFWSLLVVTTTRGRWRLAALLPLPLLLPGTPSPGWVALFLLASCLGQDLRRPDVGLLLLAASWLPILPFPGSNSVQQLSGLAGLALHLSHAAPLLGRRAPMALVAAAAAALLTTATATPPTMVGQPDDARARRAAVHGLAAASQAVGATQILGLDDSLEAREVLQLAPLWGAEPAPRGDPGPGLQVGAAVLQADPQRLLQADLLGAVDLPVARARDDRARPGRSRSTAKTTAERSAADDPGVPVDAPVGRLLFGTRDIGAGVDAGVVASDACGHIWQPPEPAAGVRAVGVVVDLREACQPLSIRRAVHAQLQRGQPFLVPLPEPDLSLRNAVLTRQVLDVRVGPVHLDPGGTGGPRPPGL